MAPRRPPEKRSAASSNSVSKNPPTISKAQADSLFPKKKDDKRRIKHAQLMSKITKSAPANARKRRPHKKLITKLDALADALPSNDDENVNATESAGTKVVQQVNVIKRRSMKSRPGAMKKRERIDKNERDRFGRNLAQMAVKPAEATSTTKSNPSEKWKALRGFIAETLEIRPDLANPHQG